MDGGWISTFNGVDYTIYGDDPKHSHPTPWSFDAAPQNHPIIIHPFSTLYTPHSPTVLRRTSRHETGIYY